MSGSSRPSSICGGRASFVTLGQQGLPCEGLPSLARTAPGRPGPSLLLCVSGNSLPHLGEEYGTMVRSPLPGQGRRRSMNVHDELPSLLATLYAAPLAPQKWQTFFERLCVLTNTSTGYLLTSDAERGNALVTGGGLQFDPDVLPVTTSTTGPRIRTSRLLKPVRGSASSMARSWCRTAA